MTRKLWLALAFLSAALWQAPSLEAASTRQAFDKAVKDLQKSPEDSALRKKIFKLGRSLDELPDAPDEVAILKGKASYIVKNAKSPAEFLDAVEAYKRATNLAPWVPDLYYNLGIVQEKAGRPADATESFKLYLAADPEAEDREKVLARLGALEVQQEKKESGAAVSGSNGTAKTVDAAAIKRWEDKRTGAMVVGILSGVTMGLGAVFVGVGLGEQSSALRTSTPGYSSNGTLYNIRYDGSYFSAKSYQQVKDGEAMAGAGWAMFAVGGLGVIIAIAMAPGKDPRLALIDWKDDKLAMGLPEFNMTPQMDGIQTTLFQAQF